MDFFTNTNLILGLIIAILGAIIGTTAWRAEPLLKKLREGLEMYRRFKDKKSAAGSKISTAERDKLIDQLGDILEEAVKLVNVVKVWDWIKSKFKK